MYHDTSIFHLGCQNFKRGTVSALLRRQENLQRKSSLICIRKGSPFFKFDARSKTSVARPLFAIMYVFYVRKYCQRLFKQLYIIDINRFVVFKYLFEYFQYFCKVLISATKGILNFIWPTMNILSDNTNIKTSNLSIIQLGFARNSYYITIQHLNH